MSIYYDSDDALPRSPGLQPFKPKSTPSPSPPPFIPRQVDPPTPEDFAGRRKRSKNNRRTKASQSDSVLISHLNPNYPDVSREAGIRALNSASQSEASESDIDMEERSEREAFPRYETLTTNVSRVFPTITTSDQIGSRTKLTINGISSKSRDDHEPPASKPKLEALTDAIIDGSNNASQKPEDPSPKLELQTPQSAHDSVLNGQSPSTLSPRARTLSVSHGPAEQTLPPLQMNPLSPANSVGSPNQTLPSFKEFVDKAEKDKKEEDTPRQNGYHRASFSTTSATSPTMSSRHYSISTQRSSSSQLPALSHASPVSAHSDISPHDPFLKSSTLNAHNTMINRRPSQASENGPPQFQPGLRSASSPDGFSPGSQASPSDSGPRMSIDGAIRPILPPPNPTVPAVPIVNVGGYKCDHPGCNAAPFSTQYLLNSHANVHSQNRPHYCPIPGCPRAEGGKGFKRKNEMIRHGLVHDSPGYVCPFCPDREHRYPRPDNLQRHVRVHHVDKDKDDPQLREVLAQRPEGGTRGRRRRGT